CADAVAFSEKLTAKGVPPGTDVLLGVLCKSEDVNAFVEAGVQHVLGTTDPRAAFQDAMTGIFPQSLGNTSTFDRGGPEFDHLPNGARVARTAELEDGVEVAANAVVGDAVRIGRGTRIGENAVIARRCKIGRNCDIGAGCVIQYALVGDRVVLSPGVKIGQEGFGFVPRATGLKKMPQLGRVVIQDDVEIGANSAVDRGTLGDTSIGQGTKLDNFVQVGHNVMIGISTVIAAHTGLSGSCRIGNFCMLGGRVGVADHVNVGDGARVAATSGVMHDIPPGEQWAGAPAQPAIQFFKQMATLRKQTLAAKKNTK
ncbi:MAG: UDP-3-O-(3-hydroxymyristoyl)glucosamine N-acyltransferase, partial [Pseudomonadota bacterium]